MANSIVACPKCGVMTTEGAHDHRCGRGRPREWDREELANSLMQYIESNDIPTVAGFAYSHGLHREQVYEMPELSYGLKLLIAKKEHALETKALTGDVNCSMAIFSLKQIGWKDTHENTIQGKGGGPIVISSTDAEL